MPRIDPRTGIPLESTDVPAGAESALQHAYAAAGANAPSIVSLGTGERAIRCPRCERTSAMTAHRCPACGLAFTIEGARPTGPAQLTALDLSCLACGAVALLTMPCGVGYVPAGAAVLLGVIATRQNPGDRRFVRCWPVYAGVAAALVAVGVGVGQALVP